MLAHQRDGVLTQGGVNYAFRPGLKLIIPYQKIELPDFPIETVQRKWWYPVIVTGYEEMQKWYNDSGILPTAPKVAHKWIPVSLDEQLKLADDSTAARKKAENAYNK